MNFGANLCHLRTMNSVNQKDLAAELQVSVGTISNYENGVHFPNLEALCKLACYFHVSTDYLLGRTQYLSSIGELEQPVNEMYTLDNIVELLPQLSQEDCQDLLHYLNMLVAHT